MQEISFFHTNFTFNHSKLFDLSVSFRRDGFSFIIIDRDDEVLYASCFQPFDESLSHGDYLIACRSFLEHEAFSYSYKHVSCLFTTERITIVPASLCNQDDLRTILEFNHSLPDDEVVFSYPLINADSVLVYAVSKKLVDYCSERFGDFVNFPHSAPLLESSILHNKLEDSYSVFISLESSFFDIVILNRGQIIMYNTYSFTNINDYVYYVMNVFEQLKLNQMKTPVILSGKISKTSSYFDATCMFIKHVSLVQALPLHTKMMSVSPFNNIPYPLFYQLFTINLCE
ncbi:MAG: DUF3822 family protein [Bacteroidales bacterium]|jgi:hypothetical protein|nr:DUF3822 family protein [Bacteroidales bacterium]